MKSGRLRRVGRGIRMRLSPSYYRRLVHYMNQGLSFTEASVLAKRDAALS